MYVPHQLHVGLSLTPDRPQYQMNWLEAQIVGIELRHLMVKVSREHSENWSRGQQKWNWLQQQNYVFVPHQQHVGLLLIPNRPQCQMDWLESSIAGFELRHLMLKE